MKYYLEEKEQVLMEVKSSEGGLTSEEAAKRLAANGKNKLNVGLDASGKPTKDYSKVVTADGKAGVDYHMVCVRFEIDF